MIVQELIAHLSRLDSDTEVVLSVSSPERTSVAELVTVVVDTTSEEDGDVKVRLQGEVDPYLPSTES